MDVDGFVRHRRPHLQILLCLGLWVSATGCGSPTSPSGLPEAPPAPPPTTPPLPPLPPPPAPGTSFAGSWQGPTALGTVNFAVSQDHRITSITLEYRFERCAGTKTFTDLSVAIVPPPAEPVLNPLSNYPNFRYQFDAGSGESTQLFCAFLTGTGCMGYAVFTYPSCGVSTHVAPLDAGKG